MDVIKEYLLVYPEDRRIYEFINLIINLNVERIANFYDISMSTVTFLRVLNKQSKDSIIRSKITELVNDNNSSLKPYEILAYTYILSDKFVYKNITNNLESKFEDVFFLKFVFRKITDSEHDIIIYIFEKDVKKVNLILRKMKSRLSYLYLYFCSKIGIDIYSDTLENIIRNINDVRLFVPLHKNINDVDAKLETLACYLIENNDHFEKTKILQKIGTNFFNVDKLVQRITIISQKRFIKDPNEKYYKNCLSNIELLMYKNENVKNKIKIAWMRVFIKSSSKKDLYINIFQELSCLYNLDPAVKEELAIHKYFLNNDSKEKFLVTPNKKITEKILNFIDDNDFSIFMFRNIFIDK